MKRSCYCKSKTGKVYVTLVLFKLSLCNALIIKTSLRFGTADRKNCNTVRYFDYWGKGTQVTVTHEDPKPPVVFRMSQCTSSSKSLILGCLATEFSPANSVNIKWSGNNITDVVQYPSTEQGSKKLKISHITISKEHLDQNNITCTAEHSENKVSQTFLFKGPTLSLVLIPTTESTFVMCVIENFNPEKINVRWKENKIYSPNQAELQYKMSADGLFTALSLYKLNNALKADTEFTCEVSHQGKQFNKTMNFKAKIALMLKPPIVKEIFVNNRVVLNAVVSGDLESTVKEALVSCKVGSLPIPATNVSLGKVGASEDTSQSVRTYTVTVDLKKWFNGERVTCSIKDTLNDGVIEQEIHFNKGDGKAPIATIYKSENNRADHVSYVCEVTSRDLSDVYMMWKVNSGPYIEGKTSAPIRQDDFTSVLSILKLKREQIQIDNSVITCAVTHANMKDTSSPLQTSISTTEPPEPETGVALDCSEHVLEEDEFRSLWSTATSFIFLFLFSLTYSAVLSLFKVKQ